MSHHSAGNAWATLRRQIAKQETACPGAGADIPQLRRRRLDWTSFEVEDKIDLVSVGRPEGDASPLRYAATSSRDLADFRG